MLLIFQNGVISPSNGQGMNSLVSPSVLVTSLGPLVICASVTAGLLNITAMQLRKVLRAVNKPIR